MPGHSNLKKYLKGEAYVYLHNLQAVALYHKDSYVHGSLCFFFLISSWFQNDVLALRTVILYKVHSIDGISLFQN